MARNTQTTDREQAIAAIMQQLAAQQPVSSGGGLTRAAVRVTGDVASTFVAELFAGVSAARTSYAIARKGAEEYHLRRHAERVYAMTNQ